MTADPVFGPLRTSGIGTCPDCRARGGVSCADTCPRRVICACSGTGWTVTVAPDGAVTQRPCRDCLGPPAELP